jgi:hypothetical protein
MTEDEITDLKQFIAVIVSQQTTELRQEMHAGFARLNMKIDNKVDGLRQEMFDGFAGVGQAIDETHERLDKRDAQVERRLARLERHTGLLT